MMGGKMNVFEKTRKLFSIIQPNELVLEMFTFIEKYYGKNKSLKRWKTIYLTDFMNNFGKIIVHIKKDHLDVYIGKLCVNQMAGALAYYLQNKYRNLEDNWDLLDEIIRTYPEEKVKTKQLPNETEDDFMKRVVASKINRISKLRELENEKLYLKMKYRFKELQMEFPETFKDCTYDLFENEVHKPKIVIYDPEYGPLYFFAKRFINCSLSEFHSMYIKKTNQEGNQ